MICCHMSSVCVLTEVGDEEAAFNDTAVSGEAQPHVAATRGQQPRGFGAALVEQLSTAVLVSYLKTF